MFYFFAALALGFAILAVWLVGRRIMVLRSGGIAVGTITKHERREIDESVGYHPTVCFRDHTGKEWKFTSNAGWGTVRTPVGTQVAVVYSRSNPEIAFVRSFLHLWSGPTAMMVFCLAAAAAAVKTNL